MASHNNNSRSLSCCLNKAMVSSPRLMYLYIGKTEINRNQRETVGKKKSREFTTLNNTEVQES